jgi:hypothetical protein
MNASLKGTLQSHSIGLPSSFRLKQPILTNAGCYPDQNMNMQVSGGEMYAVPVSADRRKSSFKFWAQALSLRLHYEVTLPESWLFPLCFLSHHRQMRRAGQNHTFIGVYGVPTVL